MASLFYFLFVLTSLQMTIAAVATKAEEEVAAGGVSMLFLFPRPSVRSSLPGFLPSSE